jgi:hypothetical protein
VTDLSYTPTFAPTDWIDNVDIVSGDGPKGFNVRFDAIRSDLQQAASVVTAIAQALGRPVGEPTGPQLLTPALDLASVTGAWSYDGIMAVHPPAGDGPFVAVMGLSLPADARLGTFRAIGLCPGPPTALDITLFRVSLTDFTAAPDTLAQISTANVTFTNPYDVTMPVDPRFAAVDPAGFRYFVRATVTSVQDPSAISVVTVQIAYTFG